MTKAKSTARLSYSINEQDHVTGPRDAPIEILMYGDYECPHCRAVHDDFKEAREQGVYGNPIRFAYRHFPVRTVHPYAQLAAEAAEAAAAQGKFWEMHDALYEHRQLDKDHILHYAADIGLDVERFSEDLDDHTYADQVREDFRSGKESNVNGTPTFFVNGKRYDGPWDWHSLLEQAEKRLRVRIQMVGERFAEISALGGIVLLAATIIALIWANSPFRELYTALWETHLTLELGRFTLSAELLEWVDDGLMALFFFVVGLEIKREILGGELAEPRRAALPVAGAVGGILVPAGIYALFNAGGPGASGWGIPMATDIAFVIGVLRLMGNRVPFSLLIFFTALAIADDLGAVLAIAIFYSSGISWLSLGVAALIFVLLLALNWGRVYATLPYALLGIALWLAFLYSGLHATIAGVLLAITIPHRSPPQMRGLLTQVATVLDTVNRPDLWDEHIDSRQQAAAQTMETITERMRSPAQHLEHVLTPWTSFVVLPIFALANAGINLQGESLQTLLNPISLGIILGLVVGKPIGITLFSWLVVRLNIAEKPSGISWWQFFAASCLAGIGFTMSLFITAAAFTDSELQATAKLAILVASVLAALLGALLLIVKKPQFKTPYVPSDGSAVR